MAEDKTLFFGLVILGFFLIIVGMFIMNLEKPEVYATFCSIGILMIIVGIIWSVCRYYPKMKLITSDKEHLFQPKHQTSASMSECEAPLKSSSQSPFTSCEASTQCEQTHLIHEKGYLKVSIDHPNVQSPPALFQPKHLDMEGHSSLQAEVLVHKDSEKERETCSSWKDITLSDGNMAGGDTIMAPLATFQEGNNPPSLQNLPLLKAVLPSCSSNKGLSHPTRSESIVFIDAVSSDSPGLLNQSATSTSESVVSIEMPLPFKLEQSMSKDSQKREDHMEDEMFYGINDERNHNFEESEKEYSSK
ncbi:barttin [Narcine bancroftii]|uniref:barttin n=1 Tax=Narcine bancroftii TaxID=1343680 RepID=UPI0038320349